MTNTANQLVWLRPQTIVSAPAQPAGLRLGLGWRLALGGACLALIMVELSGQTLLPQLPAAVAPAVTVVEAPAPEAPAPETPIEVEAEPLRVQYVHVDLLNDTSSELSAPEAPIAAQATDEPALTPPPAEGLLLNNQLAYLRYRSQAAELEVALAPEVKADIADSMNTQAQPDNQAPAPVVAPPIIALADTTSTVVAQELAARPQAAAPLPQLPEAEASSLAASQQQSPPAPEDLTFSLDSEAQLSVVGEDLPAAPSAASSADALDIADLDANLTAAASASDYVYMLDELQPERRGYYESLDFSGHLFSNKAANRFIIVDGKARAEQEALDETTVVEAITADGVILRTNGESVFVDITSRIN